MKNYFLFFMFLGFFQAALASEPQEGRVIIYREYNYQGSAVSYKIFANDSFLVKLRNKSYFEYPCPAGEYHFRVENSKNAQVQFNVEEGKTYYLRFGIQTGLWSNTFQLILVDSLSAAPIILGSELRALDASNTPLERPKNRLGLNLSSGLGFNNIPMFIMEDNKESKISFGGGFGVGAKYGYEFNRNFDIAIDFSYHSSGLRPALKNATMSVSRIIVSATPSVIVPLDGGDAMRIKFGAGIDYYSGPRINLEGSSVPGGFNEKATYDASIGFHLNSIFEMNLSDQWSMHYGLKYYNVNYDINSGGTTLQQDPGFRVAKGSGLDFVFGMMFHF